MEWPDLWESKRPDMAMTPATQHRSFPPGSPARPAFAAAVRWFLIAAGVLVLALAIGFIGFLRCLERSEPATLARADAIVALTGGADRIADAIHWLAQGHGERLLISGVGNQTSIDQLAPLAPQWKNWLHCCVDLGPQAVNTVGNAEETKQWAEARGYRSLVVVTSSYHMPRALLELRRHMPGVTLIAAPVVTERLQGLDLWRDPALLRTLFHEYGKFIVAYARARLTGPGSSDDITAHTNRRPA